MNTPDFLDRTVISDPRIIAGKAHFARLQLETTNKKIGGRRVYRVVGGFRVLYRFPGGMLSIRVPDGYETDLASIPRVFWLILTPDSCAEEAVIHDWLYRSTDVPRWFADAVMRTCMQLLERPWWTRVVVFWAVRIGGRFARQETPNGR